MPIKTLKDIDISGKTVLYRSPYDIGVKETEDGSYVLSSGSRIFATEETLKYLVKQGCKVAILTYVKRPGGKVVEKLRTTPHAEVLSKYLVQEVLKADDCVGEEVREQIDEMGPGEIIMLENTRFHPEEDEDDDAFAKELAMNGEVVVFDGFPQAHRIHASTTGILRHLPGVAGLYMEKEIEALTALKENPAKPFTLVIGGAKVSDKVDAVNNLIEATDHILIGGGTANVFLKAKGKEMGASFMEDVFVDKKRREKRDWVEYAAEIMKANPDKITIPVDLLIADDKDNPENAKIVDVTENEELVPEGWMALDIGPKTEELYARIIAESNTVFWNGPMGIFENELCSSGTQAVARAMAANKGTTVISGGDTEAAVKKLADISKITHVSLAGGATLEFLAGKKLPVLEMLEK